MHALSLPEFVDVPRSHRARRHRRHARRRRGADRLRHSQPARGPGAAHPPRLARRDRQGAGPGEAGTRSSGGTRETALLRGEPFGGGAATGRPDVFPDPCRAEPCRSLFHPAEAHRRHDAGRDRVLRRAPFRRRRVALDPAARCDRGGDRRMDRAGPVDFPPAQEAAEGGLHGSAERPRASGGLRRSRPLPGGRASARRPRTQGVRNRRSATNWRRPGPRSTSCPTARRRSRTSRTGSTTRAFARSSASCRRASDTGPRWPRPSGLASPKCETTRCCRWTRRRAGFRR